MLATRVGCRARCGRNLRQFSPQYRALQTSKTKSHAATQGTSPISNLPYTAPVLDNTSYSKPSDYQGQVLTSPFASRVVDVDALRPSASHRLSWDGKDLVVSGTGANEPPIAVSQWWLRDHCPCSTCMNQITKQRQVNNLRGAANAPRAQHVDIAPDSPHIHVTWSDGHASTFEKEFIFRRNTPALAALRQAHAPLHLWGAEIASSPPTVSYSSVTPTSLGPLMQHLRRSGLVFISSTPATAAASEALLATIGPIRATHWGGFTVVTSDLTSKDTAWTSEALEPHNDNTYFSDAAGLQMLHLLSHTHGSGGESLFVDGFAAAQQLAAEHPGLYRVLASTGVYAHSSGDDGVSVQPAEAMPVLRHDRRGVLRQVRWNNADRAGVDAPMGEVDKWYEAASAFQAILNREENRYWVQLEPGMPVIFDNWRLMHGRSEFTGKRTVCGGYVNYDDYVSRYKTACYGEEELRAATVVG